MKSKQSQAQAQLVSMLEASQHIVKAGISIIPVGKNKLPAAGLLPKGEDGRATWKPFQSTIPTDSDLESWFSDHAPFGIATIAGAVSWGLEIIDHDVQDDYSTYSEWSEMVKAENAGLFDKLVINATPSGGHHIRYRVKDFTIPGNQKLAKLDKKKTLIETRGEGGYALCPPTLGYMKVQGSLVNLPVITVAERDLLINAAKSFNRVPERNHAPQTGDRPGDQYNETDDFKQVLQKHGWTIVGSGEKELWQRPGTKNRWSATFNAPECPRLFYVFTDNADPFEVDTAYKPFSVYALLEHGGDFGSAAKALAGQGFGEQSEKRKRGHYVTDEPESIDEGRIQRTPKILVDIPFEPSRLIPPGSWLESYIQYISPTLDAPEQFTLACGVFCLSMACKDMFVRFGQTKIRPLIWLALVAPSGICRKTMSINSARFLLEEWYGAGLTFPDSLSPEAFVKHLADNDPHGFFTWSEMQSQLESFENRSYMRGYKADLTDLFDCPPTWIRKTKMDGELKIDSPFVGVIAASTQRWLNECLSEGNLKGGFLPRFLWVMAFTKPRQFDWPGAFDLEARERLTDWLAFVARSFAGGMVVSDDAKARFIKYGRKLEAEAMGTTGLEDVLGAFYTRLITYTLKFAMIYQADIQTAQNQGTNDRIITDEAMKYAVRLGEYFKAGISLLLDQMTFNDDMADWKNVLNIVQGNPGIVRSHLMRSSRLTKKRLDDALATLYERENITSIEEASNSGKGGRPKLKYYPLLDEGETEPDSVLI